MQIEHEQVSRVADGCSQQMLHSEGVNETLREIPKMRHWVDMSVLLKHHFRGLDHNFYVVTLL